MTNVVPVLPDLLRDPDGDFITFVFQTARKIEGSCLPGKVLISGCQPLSISALSADEGSRSAPGGLPQHYGSAPPWYGYWYWEWDW